MIDKGRTEVTCDSPGCKNTLDLPECCTSDALAFGYILESGWAIHVNAHESEYSIDQLVQKLENGGIPALEGEERSYFCSPQCLFRGQRMIQYLAERMN